MSEPKRCERCPGDLRPIGRLRVCSGDYRHVYLAVTPADLIHRPSLRAKFDLIAEVDALREHLAAKTARIKALEAAGEGMLELLTDHSHGVALSPHAITQAFGDWLAALSLDYVYVEPSAGPDDAQAGGEVDA